MSGALEMDNYPGYLLNISESDHKTLIAKLLVISRVFFLPDGDDISIPSEEDAFGDDFRSDPDEGIFGRFKPQHFDFSDD